MDISWITYSPISFTITTNYNYTIKYHLGVERNGWDTSAVPYLVDLINRFKRMTIIREEVDDELKNCTHVIIPPMRVCMVDYVDKVNNIRYSYMIEYER